MSFDLHFAALSTQFLRERDLSNDRTSSIGSTSKTAQQDNDIAVVPSGELVPSALPTSRTAPPLNPTINRTNIKAIA